MNTRVVVFSFDLPANYIQVISEKLCRKEENRERDSGITWGICELI